MQVGLGVGADVLAGGPPYQVGVELAARVGQFPQDVGGSGCLPVRALTWQSMRATDASSGCPVVPSCRQGSRQVTCQQSHLGQSCCGVSSGDADDAPAG